MKNLNFIEQKISVVTDNLKFKNLTEIENRNFQPTSKIKMLNANHERTLKIS
jgi:hypothetical protein